MKRGIRKEEKDYKSEGKTPDIKSRKLEDSPLSKKIEVVSKYSIGFKIKADWNSQPQ